MFCQVIVNSEGGGGEDDISTIYSDSTDNDSPADGNESIPSKIQIVETITDEDTQSNIAADNSINIDRDNSNNSSSDSSNNSSSDSSSDRNSDSDSDSSSDSDSNSSSDSSSNSNSSSDTNNSDSNNKASNNSKKILGGGNNENMYFYLIESDSKVYIIKKDNSLHIYTPNSKVESIESDLKYELGADLDIKEHVKVINMMPRGAILPRTSNLLYMISEARSVRNSIAFLLTNYRAVKLLKIMCDIGNVEVSDYITYSSPATLQFAPQKAACIVTHQDSRESSVKESAAKNAIKKSRATLIKYLTILKHLHTRAILMTYNYNPVNVFNDFRANTVAGVGGINIMNAAYVAEYDSRDIIWDIIESDREFQKVAADLVPNYSGDTLFKDDVSNSKRNKYSQGDFLQIIKICSLIDIRNAIKYSRATLSKKDTLAIDQLLSPSNMSKGTKTNCETLFPVEHVLNFLSDKK